MIEPPDNRDWQISLRALLICAIFVGVFLYVQLRCDEANRIFFTIVLGVGLAGLLFALPLKKKD